MIEQKVIWTVLPNGSEIIGPVGNETKRLHFSVFVSPRLNTTPPDIDQKKLDSYSYFRDWPSTINTMQFSLEFDPLSKPFPAMLDMEPAERFAPDNHLWELLFKPDTYVRSHEFTDLSQRVIRSYPVSSVSDFLQNAYTAVGSKSGDSLPELQATIADNGKISDPSVTLGPLLDLMGPLLEPEKEVFRVISVTAYDAFNEHRLIIKLIPAADLIKLLNNIDKNLKLKEPSITWLNDNKAKITEGSTEFFLECTGEFIELYRYINIYSRLEEELKTNHVITSSNQLGLPKVQAHFLQANRFFDRVESKEPYMAQPNLSMVKPSPEVPRIDFHQMIAAMGDYPLLLRKLGLVLDFSVDLPDSGASILPHSEVRLQITQGDIASFEKPWTFFDDSFMAKSHNSAELNEGRVNLTGTGEGFNPAQRFQLIQIDPDGAALKLIHTAGNLARQVPGKFMITIPNRFLDDLIVKNCDLNLDVLVKALNQQKRDLKEVYDKDILAQNSEISSLKKSKKDISAAEEKLYYMKRQKSLVAEMVGFKDAKVTKLPGSKWLVSSIYRTYEILYTNDEMIHVFQKNPVAYNTPTDAGLASLKSAGISLVKKEKAKWLNDQLVKAQKNETSNHNDLEFHADDLLRGYRVDIKTKRPDDPAWPEYWLSLCERTGFYKINDNRITAIDGLQDEGYIKGASSSSDNKDSDLYIHESMFRWNGWSLVVPRPGKTIVPEVFKDDLPLFIWEDVKKDPAQLLQFLGNFHHVYWAKANNVKSSDTRIEIGDPVITPSQYILIDKKSSGEVIFTYDEGKYSYQTKNANGKTLVYLKNEFYLFAIRGVTIENPKDIINFFDRYHNLQFTGSDINVSPSPFRVYASSGPNQAVMTFRNDGTATLQIKNVDYPYFYKIENGLRTVYTKISMQGENPGLPENKPATEFNLQTVFKPVTGSLPRLRFGNQYRIRVRTVDLAGNSLPLDSGKDQYASDPILYTRFEPVVPPSLIPTTPAYSRGESLENMVIRSNYDKSAVDYGKGSNNERHVFPPKTSQMMAEIHGMFDRYIDNGDLATAYEIAKKESGKLEDFYTPGIEKTPYLPDPFAKGVVFRYRQTTPLPTPSLDFSKVINKIQNCFEKWEETLSFTIRIEERRSKLKYFDDEESFAHAEDSPFWNETTRVLTVYLPKGEIAKIRYHCLISADDMNKMGIWKWLGAPASPEDIAKLGNHWMMTPYRELTLVHAVQKPLRDPTIDITGSTVDIETLAYKLKVGNTFANIKGFFHFHAKTTGKVTLLAGWSEKDDHTGDESVTIDKSASAFEIITDVMMPNILDLTLSPCTEYRHEFGDTRYRRVRYQLKTTSRFTEYFDPGTEPDSFFSRTGPEVEVDVFNSARPDSPKIKYVIPVFHWEQSAAVPKPGWQKFTRTRKGGGLRIYLERPWYSSGDGELLGIVLPRGYTDDSMKPLITQWGMDPIRQSALPDNILTINHFEAYVKSQSQLSIEESDGFLVDVVGIKPVYIKEKGLWYGDLYLKHETINSYFPFIRLALARYQPNSIVDAHLSKVVQTDFIQLANERTLNLVIDDNRTECSIEVTGYGPEYNVNGKISGNLMEVNLEKLTGPNPDFDWEPVSEGSFIKGSITLALREINYFCTWFSPTNIQLPPRPIRRNNKYRIVVREFEKYLSDASAPNYEKRLVYTDIIEL
ncbi:MAG: hypothetical protein WCK09_08270 [Bacteroidota bacterium]